MYKSMQGLWFAASLVTLFTPTVLAQQIGDPGPEIYAIEAPGVVRIHALGTNADGILAGEDGTGFVISATGYVLTASHVIPDDTKYTAVIIGGTLGPETAGAKP